MKPWEYPEYKGITYKPFRLPPKARRRSIVLHRFKKENESYKSFLYDEQSYMPHGCFQTWVDLGCPANIPFDYDLYQKILFGADIFKIEINPDNLHALLGLRNSNLKLIHKTARKYDIALEIRNLDLIETYAKLSKS